MKKHLLFGFAFLLVMAAGADAAITFSTFVTQPNIAAAEGQNNVISYTFAQNKFVGSVYVGAHNDQLYQTDLLGGTVTTFGTPLPYTGTVGGFSGTSGAGEIVLAASLGGVGGFDTGSIYAGNESSNLIEKYANSGGAPSLFATLPAGQTTKYILFDTGATFGGNMLVGTDSGNIYKVTSGGVVTFFLTLPGGGVAEGMDIANSAWGADAGNLVVASENNPLPSGTGHVLMFNPAGVQVGPSLAIPLAETINFVPTTEGNSGNPLEGYYVANYDQNIQKSGGTQFIPYQGQLLITGEQQVPGPSPVFAVAYSGNPLNPFGAPTTIGNVTSPGGQSEDAIFLTAAKIITVVPEPSSVVLFGTTLVGVSLILRRKLRRA